MTIPYGYDFTDHQVRDLVTDSHVPCEQVITSTDGTVLGPLLCQKCRANWPCAPILGVREYYDTHDGMSGGGVNLDPVSDTAA